MSQGCSGIGEEEEQEGKEQEEEEQWRPGSMAGPASITPLSKPLRVERVLKAELSISPSPARALPLLTQGPHLSEWYRHPPQCSGWSLGTILGISPTSFPVSHPSPSECTSLSNRPAMYVLCCPCPLPLPWSSLRQVLLDLCPGLLTLPPLLLPTSLPCTAQPGLLIKSKSHDVVGSLP